jgi:hypothetical protein
MPATREVIQLIDEIPVVATSIQVNEELTGGEAEDYRCGGERQVVFVTRVRVWSG